MKVKAINKNTNQQFDCKEVEIDGYKYYLYYNTEPKKIGQYYLTKDNQVGIVKTGKELGKLILCSNNPNIDIPKVVDEVEELAKEATNKQLIRIFGHESKEEILDDIQKRKFYFIKGYNKSQETHPFSEEDMIEFAEFVAKYTDKNKNYKSEILHAKSKYDEAERTIDLLQLWKEQQPKIVYYE